MDRDKLRRDLVRDEGLRLRIYTDTAGKVSVGIGHNLTDRGISLAVANAIYNEDSQEAIENLLAAVPWVVGLDDVRQRVLVNMTFNLGIATMRGFHRTLTAIREGRYGDAAEAMLQSLWASQVGDRAQRLADMMRTGIDPA